MTKEKELPKVQFTLGQALHRVIKKEILMDVVIDGTVVEDYPVAWVKIRGSQDPEYLRDIIPAYTEFREKMDESKTIKDVEEKRTFLQEITLELHTATVTVAIQNWDTKFFEGEFSRERALELFKCDKYSIIYNQVAEAMQQREDFLPLVSIQPKNG